MTSVADMSITGMRQSTTGFTLNLISNASMETYEQNTLARFTNLLPNVIELNKSMGTWQVALLEISWPSTIKNITDGRFETDACNGVDYSDDFSNGDFESMDEEEEEAKVKQENNDELYSVIQKRQETLLGSGTISRDNHSSSQLVSGRRGGKCLAQRLLRERLRQQQQQHLHQLSISPGKDWPIQFC